MLAASPTLETTRDRLFDIPSERLIAVGRIILIVFALIAVNLDTAPTTSSPVAATFAIEATSAILAAYFVLAALQGALAFRRRPSRTEQIVAHLFDVAVVS